MKLHTFNDRRVASLTAVRGLADPTTIIAVGSASVDAAADDAQYAMDEWSRKASY